MPTPTRKHSRARRDKRRANWKLAMPSLTKCQQCAAPILTHRVCPFCGSYRGEQIILIKPKATKEKT